MIPREVSNTAHFYLAARPHFVEWATSLKHNDDDNIVLSATLSLVMK
jgi:hypothetical protein